MVSSKITVISKSIPGEVPGGVSAVVHRGAGSEGQGGADPEAHGLHAARPGRLQPVRPAGEHDLCQVLYRELLEGYTKLKGVTQGIILYNFCSTSYEN